MLSDSITLNILDRQFDGFSSPPPGGLILIQNKWPFLCSKPTRPLLQAILADDQQTILFRPGCKCWNCESCAQVLKARWIFRAVSGVNTFFNDGISTNFVTITSHERLGARSSLAVLPKAWPTLRKRMNRHSEHHEYFLVPETHQDGRIHLHMLTTAGLPKKWWKDNARSCGFGFMADVQPVTSPGAAAGYVGKYLTKTLQNSNLPRGTRRVRCSQGWPEIAKKGQPTGLRFIRVDETTPLQERVEILRSGGTLVILADEKASWAWIDAVFDSTDEP